MSSMLLISCRLSSSAAEESRNESDCVKDQVCAGFGAAVRRLRTRLDLSQEEFADRVEIHRTYIGGIERGERNPTLTMITRIAAALNVSGAQLLLEAEKG